MKRPRGDGRCIHCGKHLTKATRDHVFPSSWCPDSTPSHIQRWVVPSCDDCNNKFGSMEQELLVRFGLCIDPTKAAASGISKKALAAFGIGVSGLSEKEARIRKALRDKVLGSAKPYDKRADPHIIPGLGPRAGTPPERQIQIELSGETLLEVAKKIVRGCEFWLSNGRIVEPPYELKTYVPSEMPSELIPHLKSGSDYFGPGCRIRRAMPNDEPLTRAYELRVWDTMTLAALIVPSEVPNRAEKK